MFHAGFSINFRFIELAPILYHYINVNCGKEFLLF